ncbi:hypothetical protein AQJ91_05415 [Streptomyces dysideae]|uniref:Uncharacterized protein n=1 Tax=Streptomyces dysideae TaxID=909626 RepID=A0A101V3X9_9ACTN|nr:hypothetical protein AQJ91_05415 [Streptomyces dysideae]
MGRPLLVGRTTGTPSDRAGLLSAQAAATWQAHDKNCKTFTDANAQSLGSACAEVQKRVTDADSVNGYRGRVTVNPTAGNWMKPTTYVFGSC